MSKAQRLFQTPLSLIAEWYRRDKHQIGRKGSFPMKIDGPREARAASAGQARRAGGTGATFSLPQTDSAESVAGPRATTAARPLGGIDALIALQEAPDPREGRKKAIKRASSLLESLDEIRIGLLLGRIPRSRLEELVRMVETGRDRMNDPRLETVLDEIELRARVELAKLDRP